MPRICYEPKEFRPAQLKLIGKANQILEAYAEKGFDLTVRQLYYQFVSQNIIPNKVTAYDNLSVLISNARIAGLLDWHHIVDRTRHVIGHQHFDRPSGVLEAAAKKYATDRWANQDHYVEVWVEKNALIGVLNGICSELDVKHFATVGYNSQTAMWNAAQRLLTQKGKGKEVHIIHLGDHDPSGMDMSRDIFSRLSMFTYGKVHVQRVALNMPQIEKYNPPPQPGKVTDSRFVEYQTKYGDESWELDALTPEVIVDIIERAVLQYRDDDRWNEAVQKEERGKKTLATLLDNFTDVVGFLRTKYVAPKVLCSTCGATEEQPFCLCRGVSLLGQKRLDK